MIWPIYMYLLDSTLTAEENVDELPQGQSSTEWGAAHTQKLISTKWEVRYLKSKSKCLNNRLSYSVKFFFY